MNSLSEIAKLIRSAESILVCSHVFPDPDATGSSCALQLALKKLNISSSALISGETLPRMKEFVANVDILKSSEQESFDLVVALDTATKARADGLPEQGEVQIVNIDHHQSNTLWGDFNYIDSSAASSSMIVFELLKELQVELSPEIADLLYAGLMDDTGSFRFSNTDERALRAAADLVAEGACPERVANSLYFAVPERVIRLKAKALESLKLYQQGAIGTISMSSKTLEQLGAVADDTDGLVDIPRSIEGVKAAVFIREFQVKWKLSLRSKSKDLNVNKVAGLFGGGGHAAAAGCTIEGTLAEVEEKVVDALTEALGDVSS